MNTSNTSFCINHMAFALASVLAVMASAHAQTQPTDAGQTLNVLQKVPQPLPEGKELVLPADIRTKVEQDGKTVSIKSLRFTGNQHFDDSSLMRALGAESTWAQPLDLVALQGLITKVTDYYRESGYPFARAFLLPGSLNDAGELNIRIVEGHYGQIVTISPDEKIVQGVTPFLSGLKIGEVITTQALERATLLLNDLPGYTVTPVIKPGTEVGTGDLNVVVENEKRIQGSVGLDNHGSAYSGEFRVQSNLAVNRVAVFGDELALSAIAPIDGTWMGGWTYAIPIGSQGTRLSLASTRTAYTLDGDFEGFSGHAAEKSIGVSYPIVRSRASNLSVAMSYKDKNLQDTRLGVTDRKDVTATPLVFNFDHRDGLGQGGVTYGAMTVMRGKLETAGNQTDFGRWQIDVARQQRWNTSWTLYAHGVVQGTHDNLDSSEGFSLGGATGVRAYPSGEASGDEGWLLQLEVRKSLGTFELYGFYDHGKVKVDARPELVFKPAPDLERAGAGVGVRMHEGAMKVNLAMAWRTKGGAPTAETGSDPKPRLWLSANYSF